MEGEEACGQAEIEEISRGKGRKGAHKNMCSPGRTGGTDVQRNIFLFGYIRVHPGTTWYILEMEGEEAVVNVEWLGERG